MSTGEEIIQSALNAAGQLATAELLKTFDTDGSAIEICGLRLTSKGKVLKEYETPYEKIGIERHVYQNDNGGNTFCPLDKEARIIGTSTPRLAKIISNKYSRNSVDEVQDDLKATMTDVYPANTSKILQITLVRLHLIKKKVGVMYLH